MIGRAVSLHNKYRHSGTLRLVEGFFRADFGANVAYHIHLFSLVLAVVLAIALATLAGIYPAWRAAKTNITEALSYE